MALTLAQQARQKLGFGSDQKLTGKQTGQVNTEIGRLKKIQEQSITVGGPLPTFAPDTGKTITVGNVPNFTPFYQGIGLAPSDVAAGVTPQSIARQDAFRQIAMDEQNGKIDLAEANRRRQEVDRMFPPDVGTRALFNQAQEGLKARDLSSIEPPSQPTGQTSFNTGNPKIDDFLNNVWLPYIEATLSGNPQALMSEDAFNKIAADAEAKFKPAYGLELEEAKQTYTRSTEELGAQKTDFEKQQELAKTRTLEDLATGKQRIARNYSEAVRDSADSMAARGLAFGGSRLRAERKLGEEKTLAEQELSRATNRTLENLQREEVLKTGQYGRQLSELEQEYGTTQRQLGSQYEQGTQGYISAEQAKRQAEKDRMLGLASDILQNRNLLPQ